MKYIAAYLLAVMGGNDSPTASDIEHILGAVGIQADQVLLSKMLAEVHGKNVDELIAEGVTQLSTSQVPSHFRSQPKVEVPELKIDEVDLSEKVSDLRQKQQELSRQKSSLKCEVCRKEFDQEHESEFLGHQKICRLENWHPASWGPFVANLPAEARHPACFEPTKLSLALTSEVPGVFFGIEKELTVMASIKAPKISSSDRPPLDLVCVIDRSGSMAGERLKLVLRSINFIIKNSQDQDCMSIVIYDHGVETICPFTKMNQDGKVAVRKRVDGVRAGGQTNLVAGLLKGIEEMRHKPLEQGRVRTLMIFTDGEANRGYTSTEQIIRATIDRDYARESEGCQFISSRKPELQGVAAWDHQGVINYLSGLELGDAKDEIIAKFHEAKVNGQELMELTQAGLDDSTDDWLEREMNVLNKLHRVRIIQGIKKADDEESKTPTDEREALPCAIYTFGFGRDHSASLLSAIAEHGNGIYYFIDNVKEIPRIFRDCLGGLTTTMSQQIVLTLEMIRSENEGGADNKLQNVLNSGFQKNKLSDYAFEVILGDMQSQESRNILMKTKLPALVNPENKTAFMKAQVNYHNLQTNRDDVVTAELSIHRPNVDETKEGDTINLEINRQFNRICAASAIANASELAEAGNLGDARAAIQRVTESIETSVTGKEGQCQELLRTLKHCEDGLKSVRRFQVRGAKIMKGYGQSHSLQRVALPAYDDTYANDGRMDLWGASDSEEESDEDGYAGGLFCGSPGYSTDDDSDESD